MSLVLKLIVVLDFIFLFLYLVYTDPVRENLWGRDSGPIRDSPIQAKGRYMQLTGILQLFDFVMLFSLPLAIIYVTHLMLSLSKSLENNKIVLPAHDHGSFFHNP